VLSVAFLDGLRVKFRKRNTGNTENYENHREIDLPIQFPPRDAPLRFAITLPPSGCEEDFHLQAIEHARHTKKRERLGASRTDHVEVSS